MNTVASVESPKRKVGILLAVGIFLVPLVFSWFLLRKGHSTLARVLGFGWLGFVLLVMLAGPSKAPKSAAPSQEAEQQVVAEPEPVRVSAIKVTARELFQAYKANEIAADGQFKDKKLEISGAVESIESDFSDEPVVQLKAGEFLENVHLKGLDKATAANLSKGQQIKAQCIGSGEAIGFPLLDECTLL